MLQNGKTYVAFDVWETVACVVPIVRNTPEPPWELSALPTFRDAQRFVYSVWPDAVRVSLDTIDDPVSCIPEHVASLKGKL